VGVKTEIVLRKHYNSNCVTIDCILDLPEKDLVSKRDFQIYKETQTIIPTTYNKWELYQEIPNVIALLFNRIAANVERTKLYGLNPK